MFAYCNNNPITMSDLMGNVPTRATMMSDSGSSSLSFRFSDKKSKMLYKHLDSKNEYPQGFTKSVHIRKIGDYVEPNHTVGKSIPDGLTTTAVSTYVGFKAGTVMGGVGGAIVGVIAGIATGVVLALTNQNDIVPGTYNQYAATISGYTMYPTYNGMEYCNYTYTAFYIEYTIGDKTAWRKISSDISYSYKTVYLPK